MFKDLEPITILYYLIAIIFSIIISIFIHNKYKLKPISPDLLNKIIEKNKKPNKEKIKTLINRVNNDIKKHNDLTTSIKIKINTNVSSVDFYEVCRLLGENNWKIEANRYSSTSESEIIIKAKNKKTFVDSILNWFN